MKSLLNIPLVPKFGNVAAVRRTALREISFRADLSFPSPPFTFYLFPFTFPP